MGDQLPSHVNGSREYSEQFVSIVRDRFPTVFDYVHSLLAPTLQIQLYSPPSPPATVASKPPQLSPSGLGLFNKIPRTEEQWRVARTYLGINDDQHILSCLSSIQKCGDNHDSIATLGKRVTEIRKDRKSSACLVALTSFLFIITCHLDGSGNRAVKSALESFLDDKFGSESRIPKRIMAGALRLVTLADSLYHKFQHRAFEILIHIIRLENGAMQYTNIWKATQNDLDLIKSHIHSWDLTDEFQTNLTNEIQAGAPFSIVFLLQLWRPTYDLAQIGKSLKTNLDYTGPNILLQVLQEASLVPCRKRKRDKGDYQTRAAATIPTQDDVERDMPCWENPILFSDDGLLPHTYEYVEALPSQNVGLEEVDDDWLNAIVARDISTNGQPEHSF